MVLFLHITIRFLAVLGKIANVFAMFIKLFLNQSIFIVVTNTCIFYKKGVIKKMVNNAIHVL